MTDHCLPCLQEWQGTPQQVWELGLHLAQACLCSQWWLSLVTRSFGSLSSTINGSVTMTTWCISSTHIHKIRIVCKDITHDLRLRHCEEKIEVLPNIYFKVENKDSKWHKVSKINKKILKLIWCWKFSSGVRNKQRIFDEPECIWLRSGSMEYANNRHISCC